VSIINAPTYIYNKIYGKQGTQEEYANNNFFVFQHEGAEGAILERMPPQNLLENFAQVWNRDW
jgi:hypothetical protein